MAPPNDITLPFFAYGIFKSGQLAFHQLKELVKEVQRDVSLEGELRIRDGLPIIVPSRDSQVIGDLLVFDSSKQVEAYKRLADMEPKKHYKWMVSTVSGSRVNVLFGKVPQDSPTAGSVPFEGTMWRGQDDPSFTVALDVVEETLEASTEFSWDLKSFFRLQMAYLLLWSSIERYVSLRYHLGSNATQKVYRLAEESAFKDKLSDELKSKRKRTIYAADEPKNSVELNAGIPLSSIKYYYQIRSNIVHRGKSAPPDFDTLNNSLSELLPIFRYVIRKAFEEAEYKIRTYAEAGVKLKL